MIILAVDPGLHGALAVLDTEHPEEARVFDMPLTRDRKIDAPALAKLVHQIRSPYFCLEEVVGAVENVHSRPRQAGAFNFGLSTGIVHGVFAANHVPINLVAPSLWKAKMGLCRIGDETTDENKTRARTKASELFPHLQKQFARKKDDGRAEALLLAVFWARFSKR